MLYPDLSNLLRNKTFHGIFVDTLFAGGEAADGDFTAKPFLRRQKQMLRKLIIDGIQSGAVRPLNRTIFGRDEAEEAFRFMAAGKHIGKFIFLELLLINFSLQGKWY